MHDSVYLHKLYGPFTDFELQLPTRNDAYNKQYFWYFYFNLCGVPDSFLTYFFTNEIIWVMIFWCLIFYHKKNNNRRKTVYFLEAGCDDGRLWKHQLLALFIEL